jgi:hypothetical protein
MVMLWPSQKVQKRGKWQLTVGRGAAYIRHTTRAAAPQAAEKFALVDEIQESRVSDLYRA